MDLLDVWSDWIIKSVLGGFTMGTEKMTDPQVTCTCGKAIWQRHNEQCPLFFEELQRFPSPSEEANKQLANKDQVMCGCGCHKKDGTYYSESAICCQCRQSDPAAKARELTCTIADLLNYKAISRQDADNFDAVVKEIAAAIAAERKAGREEGFENGMNAWQIKCLDVRQAALEEIAKMLESEIVAGAPDVYIMTMRTLADRIRRLKGDKK